MQLKIFISLLLLSLVACTPSDPYQDRKFQQQFYVFGTLVGITLWDESPEKAEKAAQTLVQTFQEYHQQWHSWQADSQLTALNQAIAAGESWQVHDSLISPLTVMAQHFYQTSDGFFNPAIGQLVGLWGFHADELPTGPLPSEKQIAKLLAAKPKMTDIQVKGHVISANNPAVQLDFGAFAKGYALDLIIEKLKSMGIKNAIVNAGGNLKAIGKAGDRPWMIGIRHPSPTEKVGVIAAIPVETEMSVVTSGNYERYREFEGSRYSHIIDPNTGWPVKGVSSVTVVDESATLADAASTALMVAGLQDWHRIARQMGVKYVMLIDGSHTVHVNPKMARLAEFQRRNLPDAVVSKPLE